MTIFEDNPSMIQGDELSTPWQRANGPTPVVLIHDGGGTIFSYYCLGDIGRPVFGIHNPHYNTQDVFPGGIPEMARNYADIVAGVVPRGGSVILGGWSLGGLLSLQVAHALAGVRPGKTGPLARYNIRVQGIVMIDSVCPLILRDPKPKVAPYVVEWGPNTRQETKDAVLRCFDQAFKMVAKWTLPRWDDDPKVQRRRSAGAGGGAGGAGGVENVATDFVELPEEPMPRGPPPSVILLRAVESVPLVKQADGEREGEGEGGMSRVDIHRTDQLLGWGQYREDLIHQTIDVPGHHFNMFATDEHLEAVTEQLKIACQSIEDMASGHG